MKQAQDQLNAPCEEEKPKEKKKKKPRKAAKKKVSQNESGTKRSHQDDLVTKATQLAQANWKTEMSKCIKL